MKNTVKLIVAAFVVTLAVSCGTKSETGETKDTVVVETPAAAPDTTIVPADTLANDTTVVK
jgi:hypothetical protein